MNLATDECIMTTNKVLQSLQKLLKLDYNSIESVNDTSSLLLLVFQQSKPLFVEEKEKQLASSLLNQTIPYFKYCFERFNIKAEPEFCQHYQQSRSGLQYLIDEFKSQGLCEEFCTLVDFGHVKSVEDYIRNCSENPLEYPFELDCKPQEKIEIDQIPKSHRWWFLTIDQ